MFVYKKLSGFTYNIIKDKKKIRPFLLKWLGREWRIDHKERPDQIWTIKWLKDLRKMQFDLRIVDINKIKLRKDLMNYKKGRYIFRDELKDRCADRLESIQRGVSIEPLVVRKKDMQLMDGYSRFSVLKKLGAKKVYVYMGS